MIHVLAIGEVLWDVFPDGPRFGGAPANFACACARLGRDAVRVSLASAVGRDPLGIAAEEQLRHAGVGTHLLSRLDRPTGQVLVELAPDGQPQYRFADQPAWDDIRGTAELETASASADVICFGTLAQRAEPSRRTVFQLLANVVRPNQLRVLDLNLRAPYWTESIIRQSLPLANVLKLNDEELPILARALDLRGRDEDILTALLDQFSFRTIALTRGPAGSILVSHTGERSERTGKRVTIADTVGAGDAFTAALTLGLAHRIPLAQLHDWAGRVAEYVCTQPGATPEFPAEFSLTSIANLP
jgi:fructokinase